MVLDKDAKASAAPRAASEDGLNFHVWHIDAVGQADRFMGTYSSLLDAQALVERGSPDPTAVWISEPGLHFHVAEDGLVTSLIDERSVGSPFQDRLYASRGQHAVPGGASTVDTPNAIVPRPSEEAVAAARAAPKGREKTEAEAKREREEAAKREASGHGSR